MPSSTRELSTRTAALLTGVATLALSVMAHSAATDAGMKLKVVHSFSGSDGINPGLDSVLHKGPGGALYGVLQQGGASNNGVLYRVSPADRFTLLYSFAGALDGSQPTALVAGGLGILYGTTAFGGVYSYGTAFRIGLDGSVNTIHQFDGSDANHPTGTLVWLNGALYGASGGSGISARGTIYRMTPTGDVTTAFDFNDSADEVPDYYGLSRTARGVLYGTTSAGYPADAHGTVFRFAPTSVFTTLHIFLGGNDGSLPTNAPVEAADGNLYGTTLFGGDYGCGTIYKVSPSGIYTVAYSFRGASAGCTPLTPLTVAQNGRLYGTTAAGGALDRGTIFEFRISGVLRTLYSFKETEDGCCGLMEATPGMFYGMTAGGGDFGLGSIYKFRIN
jgi:uncharacterized repeat protein (TIGR03803 family)